MKKYWYLLLMMLVHGLAKSQLSGVVSVPSTYSSIAAALSAINQQGVSGALIVNIAAGYTETVISGGFSLTATGNATSPVIFQKSGSGSNPLLIAYSGGSGTPGSMQQDGVWRLLGSDYITIDGIDITDLNTSNPSTMEFGFGLFKANSADGCQNNTIQNCVITLNRVNNASGTGPASDGSRGIDVVNGSSSVHNAVIAVISSAGSNSNNHFFSNTIQNCNIGISLIGYADTSPFNFADTGNDVGGNSISTGNAILDFGGGGTANAAAAIRTLAQYNLNLSYNRVNNNTGSGINHSVILRGIYLNAAASANSTVNNNTLTLQGGATSSQLSVIENNSGSNPSGNTVTINNNVIINCTYATAVSGPFYGIWNTGAPQNLSISNNAFINNSTSAASGSTYLIYNNGAVPSRIAINSNSLSFTYNGSSAYTGNMYSVYNANGTTTSSLTIQNTIFANYYHLGFAATANLYFISNTNDSYNASFQNNIWKNLALNHSGAQYLIHNNSTTQNLLDVSSNSITGAFNRTASAGNTYLYYAPGSSPASCIQTFTGNNFSNITATVSGNGTFYGIYSSDGASSPYPKKTIANNVISNIDMNSTGVFYGYFLDNLGDGSTLSGSSVYSNTLTSILRSGVIYGMYISGTVSPNYAPQVYGNSIHNLNSSGNASNLYGVYMAGGGAGLNFFKNKISNLSQTGTAGLAHGVYISSAANTTLASNFIGNIYAPNSSATNAVNGININGGTLINVLYNTVYLNATSTGGNFNSNALYTSSTTSLNLCNTILVNTSSGGTGIAAAYRRSSTSLTNYLTSSNTNLFYAGTPSPANVILQSGANSYQTLTSFQSAVTPREAASVSQALTFLSVTGSSPNYLRVTPNVSSVVESGALAIAGIIDDFDNEIRHGNPGYAGSGTAPDIGADEYNQNVNPCTVANAGVVSPLNTALCAGQSASLISNGYTPGIGLTHQWKFSAVAGGPYTNVSGGNGSASPEFFSANLTTGTYYFVMLTTCTNIPVSATSIEATVVVNPIPLVSANAAFTLVCAAQTLSLNGLASTGSFYQWSGPNGFNSTLQSPTIINATQNASGIYYLAANANGCVSPQASVAISVSEASLALAATSTVLCSGNSATLSIISSAITYTWSTGANGLSCVVSPTTNTSYSITVKNTANCSASKSIAISVVNPSITANNAVVCGSVANAFLSVNVFTPSLVYWYNSPTSTLSIGTGITYTTSITASAVFYAEASHTLSGCQSTRVPVSVTLSANPILLASATPSVVCPGKTSTLTVMGATTYSWIGIGIGSGSNHAVSPIANKIYTVTGRNALGCSSTETVLVSTYSLAIISVVQTATSVCPSAIVGFTATGANSYYWNTGANGAITTVSPATHASYTVYGSSSQSCISVYTLAVVTRSVPLISITQSTTQVCAGERITFTATGANSYTWLPGNIISTTFTANPVVNSVYNAIGKSMNTCTHVAIASALVEVCAAIDKNKLSQSEIVIYPNPTNGYVTIRIDKEEKGKISIISFFGNLIFESELLNETSTINLSRFPKGVYLVRASVKNKWIQQKLVLD